MHCTNCGAQQSEGAQFCSACGVRVGDPSGSTGAKPKKKLSGCMLAALIIGAIGVLAVPIVGIIAAIAIPNLLNAIDRGKQKRTVVDLQSLGTAIDSYSIEHGVYPTADDLDELLPLISPDFIDSPPTVDGWAMPIEAVSTAEGYALVSMGKDGISDGCGGGAQQSFDADICYSNGRFIQWPDGIQR